MSIFSEEKVIFFRNESEIIKSWVPDTEPVVSIVCITYNHERFISNAIPIP